MMSKMWMTGLLVAVVAGASGGVVAALATESYLTRYTASLEQVGTPPRLSDERTRVVSGVTSETLDRVRDRVLPSVVEWYRKLPETASIVRGSYVSDAAIGSGAVVSSDGWVLTSQEVFRAASATQMVAVIGTRVYGVVEAIEDPATDAMLVKLDATNLPVLSFGDPTTLRVGDQVAVADRSHRFGFATVADMALANAVSITSEELEERIGLTMSSVVVSGSVVVNGGGEFVGYLHGSGQLQALDQLTPVIRRVLKGESVVRPRLGVDVVMLDRAIGHEAFGSGALVVTAPAFGTPARAAGLKVNDVILRVAGRDVGGDATIARILLDNKPGDTVTLNVKRDGETMDVDVVLDERI